LKIMHTYQRGSAPIKLVAGVAALALVGGSAWFLLQPRTPEAQLNALAEDFVVMATAMAGINENYVDNYFGPSSLDSRSRGSFPELREMVSQADLLAQDLAALQVPQLSARKTTLQDKVARLQELLSIVSAPSKPSFAEELERLYGITMDSETMDQQANLDALQELLPGRGTLAFRVAAFRNRFVIPADKRKAVFEAALAECKRRTLEHWNLGADESLTVEWTRDVPAAWHRYLGQGQSLLQVNDLSIAFLDNAVDIACHEGYPGHHAQYVLMDQQSDLGVEDTVTLLRSTEAIVLEGAANYGVHLAFTPEEKLAFERDVLAPIAGISLPDESQYLAFGKLMDQFVYGIPAIVEEYYDGVISFNEGTFRLEKEAMVASSSALLEYIDEFGTYSIGYTYAEEQIRSAVSGGEAWALLKGIVIAPAAAAPSLFE
jgi:hypothetical protein